MLILGLESSCDETAAAIYEDGLVLSNIVRSQVDLHKCYGGVVPEIASRAHLEAIDEVTYAALEQAGRKLSDLDGVAVTQGPGLVGALLVALNFAKSLAWSLSIPLIGVNHVKAHALAPFMSVPQGPSAPKPTFPLAALVVSGGHTHLYRMNDYLNFTLLGCTRDDAAGEAFDKTAKILGLGYPGGRIIEEMAARGNPLAYKLPRPMIHEGLDFSFSGLKTKVMSICRDEKLIGRSVADTVLCDLAASFQAAAVEVLTVKLLKACQAIKAKGAVLAGGVAANGALRKEAAKLLGADIPLFAPPLSWCVDNGAMIAHLGARQLMAGDAPLGLEAEAWPRWPVC
ncbi:MAG: tRNA (adenosine(37)-N6)-threonylcarbamoyltransferase complex transferase subunit TsaD [Candidatus Adiutrix sp.]